MRLDLYLSGLADLGLTRSKVQKLIESGKVTVNGLATASKQLLRGGESIVIDVPAPAPIGVLGEDIPLNVAYEDEHLLVVDKPAGMVSHPAAGVYYGTLVNALVYRFAHLPAFSVGERPGIVHRLDKNTAGLLLVAKTENVLAQLQAALQKRDIHRTYAALVCGHMQDDEGEIDLPIGRSVRDRTKMTVSGAQSRQAVTRYQLGDRFRSYDLLEIGLLTGRTHQIRVHLAHLGHPVFGDPEYGGREKWHRGIFAPERQLAKRLLSLISRQALHAKRLEFKHPVTGLTVIVESPLPADFQSVLNLLDSDGR